MNAHHEAACGGMPSSVRNLLLQDQRARMLRPGHALRGPHKTARERFHAKFVRATQFEETRNREEKE